ncbi:FadR/GntR family transcriptional regulator [Stackebrandtia nassauensis]|uniref:GntR domain protein n=1 Tax=Stackebrandtia nassauensis (strain DSM 44728 / CIP 108903 / NRRL B-16338 / NBRC 102104 / LLR-40K-21) TaxID=446470 RepID=D3QC34_STANL|nr:FadR/GntR family transcriptional regulator [Stackebrandtia nassauensis]ADD39768.1 GntR domain protein [Stackebrandtia nassauensis DSM 44728]
MTNYTRRGLHGQTVREVARRILTGELPPGATIAVTELEAEMDVSRTAMREALKVLSAKGLVGARQKRGTFVRERSDWNLLDADIIRWQFADRSDEAFLDNLHELRGIVEPAGVRLAAERRTEADLRAIDAALAKMATAQAEGDTTLAVTADLEFHRALLTATHNELLERMEVLIETGLATRDRLVHGAHPHDDPVPSHRAVAEAVRRGFPAAAEQAMRELLDKAKNDQRRTTGGS